MTQATPATSEPTSPQALQSQQNQARRIVMNALAFVFIVAAVWVTVENAFQWVSITVFGQEVEMSLGAFLEVVAVVFALGVSLRLSDAMMATGRQMQFSKRKIERLEVTSEASTERVKVLEHKIETLEVALKKALSDKNKK